jgi:uncharacterized cupredoxin-like copper-binding protein
MRQNKQAAPKGVFAMSRLLALAAGAAIWAMSAHADPGMSGHRHEAGAGTDGRPGRPSEVSRTVRITAGDTAFSTSRIRVRPGETIRFVITSKSSIPHEFVIASHQEQLEHRRMMQQMPDMTMEDEPNAVTIGPGETKQLVWTFGKDRDVEFACDIPGHAEQGMAGKFEVIK